MIEMLKRMKKSKLQVISNFSAGKKKVWDTRGASLAGVTYSSAFARALFIVCQYYRLIVF